MTGNTTTASNDESNRPEAVPPKFRQVPADDAGYAITGDDLWVEVMDVDAGTGEVEYGTEFMLRICPGVRDPSKAFLIISRAARSTPDVPSAIRHITERSGFIRGDLTDLDALVTALKYYENYEAGIGEDKFAYEMRTAANHAHHPLRNRIEDE